MMNKNIEHCLKAYKALEKLCTAYDSAWNKCRQFNSVFSHFSVKTTQLQMFAYNQTILLDPVMVDNKRSVVINPAQLNINMQLLAAEIDGLITQMEELLQTECSGRTGFNALFLKAAEETRTNR